MVKGIGRFATIVALGLCVPLASGSIMIDTVPVGNAGNAGEMSGAGAGGIGPSRICGAVDYEYQMGKYEITAGQYTEFLNAVAATDTYSLYHEFMWTMDVNCGIQRFGSSGNYTYSVADDYKKRPVNFVTFADAARFANWMHNGQPTGAQDLSTTEDGSYFLYGVMTPDALGMIEREADATWVIPNEDEWYKSAYHKNDGVTNNYWDFPTQTDYPNMPNNGNPEGDTGNSANFIDGMDATLGSPYWTTEVGTFALSGSAYGTYDQGGNVYEICHTVVDGTGVVVRGQCASSLDYGAMGMISWLRLSDCIVGNERAEVGFRLACVPEPSSLMLMGLAGIALLRRRK